MLSFLVFEKRFYKLKKIREIDLEFHENFVFREIIKLLFRSFESVEFYTRVKEFVLVS